MSTVNTYISLFLILLSYGVKAQVVDYSILINKDAGVVNGCDVLATNQNVVSGIEDRVNARVDLNTFQITELTISHCNNGVFSTAKDLGGGYAVGLNVGIADSEVIELSVQTNQLSGFNGSAIQLIAVADDGAGSDLLSTINGLPDGAPILLGFPTAVPIFHWLALLLLILSVVFIARQFGFNKKLLVGMVFVTSIAWAATFVTDGDVTDWQGRSALANDPSNDSTDGAPRTDIRGLFATIQQDKLFFRMDVTDLENTAPVAFDDTYVVSEKGLLTELAPGVLANDTDQEGNILQTVLIDSPIQAVSFSLDLNGSFNYQPVADFVGVDSFTYSASDGSTLSNVATVTIEVGAVNDAPSFDITSNTVANEDAGPQSLVDFASNIVAGPADESTQTVVFNITNNDNTALFNVQPALSADGTLTFTPAADANGVTNVTVVLMDDGGTANGGVDTSLPQVFSINVNAVNDAPSFDLMSTVSVAEDGGAQNIANVASNISAGPADESAQILSFNVVNNSNTGLFSAQPQLNSAGALTFTLATDANGSAEITVNLSDDGGTANGGVDTSANSMFTISTAGINDAPSFDVAANTTVNEDSGAQSVMGFASNIIPGPVDESGQMLTFNITNNDNTALFSIQPTLASDGTLSFTPADDAFGAASITVTLMDDGGTANGGVDTSAPQNFTITVNPVNDVPSFSAISDISLFEGSSSQSELGVIVGISPGPGNESSQTVSFDIVNVTNASNFTQLPTVDGTGLVEFELSPSGNGQSIVTLRAVDDGGTANGGTDTSATQSFAFNITSINDAPEFQLAASSNVNEDAGAVSIIDFASNISAGPANESSQTLNFMITANDNPSLFSVAPSLAVNGVLSYTPAADANGVANLSVVLIDDGGTLNGGQDTSAPQNFTITVTPVVDLPVAVDDSVSVDEDDPATSVDVLSNDNNVDGGIISITGVTQPANGTVVITNAGADLTYEPNPEACNDGTPTDDFTYSLTPGGSVATVAVTVNCVNDLPQVVNESFETVANTVLQLGAVPSLTPVVFVSGSVLSNDSDIDGPNPSLTASLNTATAGAQVTVNADGSFTYLPPAGQVSNDSFTYDVTDGVAVVTGTVNISFQGRVWYVDNTETSGGLGRSIDPFDTLAEAEAFSELGDTIYVFAGDGTSTGQNLGFNLKSAQRLLGEGIDLTVSDTVNGVVGPTLFDSISNNQPVITGPANSDVITVNATSASLLGIEIRGLELSETSTTDVNTGIRVTAGSTFVAEVTIADNFINRTNLNGIDMVVTNAATGRALIENNRVLRWNLHGVYTAARGNAQLDVTMRGNTVETAGPISTDAFRIESGDGTVAESPRVCLDVLDTVAPFGNNNIGTPLAFDESFEIQQRIGSVFQLEGLAVSDCSGIPCDGTSNNRVEEFLIDNNGGTANVRTAGRIVQYTDGTCALPNPL